MRDLMRRLSGAAPAADAPSQDGTLGRRGSNEPKIRPEDTPDALMAEIKYQEARRYASENRWGANLDTLNKVLVLQRKSLGEDHHLSGRTLNDIGVALMNLGRFFPAQTAFKEAQYIREEALGCGAPEVAETLTNLAILMDKVNQSETLAHEREEKREVVRRASKGSLSAMDGGLSPDVVAKLAQYDSSASDFDGYDHSDSGSDDDSGDEREEHEKKKIMDELHRLEERREQMRQMSMQMAADRKRMSMEHMEAQKQAAAQQQQGGGRRQRRGSAFSRPAMTAPLAGEVAGGGAKKSLEELEKEIFSGGARRRKAGGSLGALNTSFAGLNAMDAAKAAAAAARGEDVGMALRRKSNGSVGALSVDAAMAAAGFDDLDDSDSESDDFEEPQPDRPRRAPRRRPSLGAFAGGFRGGGGGGGEGEPRSSPEAQPRARRRPSFGALAGNLKVGGGGEREQKEANLPRPKSFDAISMGAGQVDLRTQIKNDHKPAKKRLSGGILASAIGAFADDYGDDSDSDSDMDDHVRAKRTNREQNANENQGWDTMREQTSRKQQEQQSGDRPVRRFSNGLLSKFQDSMRSDGSGASGGAVDYVSDQLREKMVFSGT